MVSDLRKATGQILHPDHPDKYNIKAFVTGIAESKTISANYKPLISSFKYSFTNNNRTLIVGPIKSFMSQLIPDGIKVVVKVFHNNNLVTTLQEDTSRGVAKFNFSADFFKEKNYRFEIITLGIIQNTTTLNYGID